MLFGKLDYKTKNELSHTHLDHPHTRSVRKANCFWDLEHIECTTAIVYCYINTLENELEHMHFEGLQERLYLVCFW